MSLVELNVANMALGHLGQSKTIADLSTEVSAERNAVVTFLDISRDATLRDFQWPHATEYKTLSLVEEEPNSQWNYSYRYPTDCVDFRKILSGVRNENRSIKVPHAIARDASGRLIFTDKEDAVGIYTARITDPSKMPPDFVLAWSLRLAHYIVPRVTSENHRELRQEIFALYQDEIDRAKANAGNEEQPDVEPDSELVLARHGDISTIRGT